jgi:hypothetical protein
LGDTFDNTAVMDDLQSSYLVDGTKFNLDDYPYNEHGELRIINFVEYGYSFRSYLRYDYGLYIYVYNPQGLNIDTESLSNKVQMATKYINNEPTDYTKFLLKLCSVSIGSQNRLFYKFKIDFTDTEKDALISRLDTERRYDISGIELFEVGSTNATEYKYGVTIKATGYAKGLGMAVEDENTLSVSVEVLETLELSLQHTYFDNYAGNNISKRLNSVYFAVDNEYFDYYGSLQRIKAEWYEYKLKDLLVTSSSVVYNGIYPYLRQQVNSYNANIGRTLATDANVNGLLGNYDFGKVYNSYFTEWYDSKIETLYLMFKVDEITKQGGIYYGGVTGEELQAVITDYVNTNFNSDFNAADLFESDIDSYRVRNDIFGNIQRGYSYYDFYYGQSIGDMLGYDHNDNSFIENIKESGLWNAIFNPDKNDTPSFPNILPIDILSVDDFDMSYDQISKNIYVNENDVRELKHFVEYCDDNGKKVVLFHFAVSDYYSEMASILDLDAFFPSQWDNQAYFSSETIFHNFDIIQLTFLKDGIYMIIPVVASPIDIVSDIVPPYNMPDGETLLDKIIAFLKQWGMTILLCLLGLILLPPLLPYIIQFVFWLIKIPIHFIKYIFTLFRGGG